MRRSWVPYVWVVAGLHVCGILLLAGSLADHPYLLGLGFLAYTLGLRHAFDVDHIVAIDNVVRKLIRQKQDPTGVGFYFSLGHSTVVLVLSVGAAFFVKGVVEKLPTFQEIGGMIGMLVPGSFLLLIGLLNLFVLIEILTVFRKMKHKSSTNAQVQAHGDLEDVLQARGLFSRWLNGSMQVVRKSWHVYPLGFLFGLGLDTASEIVMLALSGGVTGHEVPLTGMLALPALFTAGMCLLDTADGIFMTKNYRWALVNPIRKIYYNLTVTALSVLAALGIGGLELAQAVLPQFEGDVGWMGYSLVLLFGLAWACSYGIWRFFRIEQRWGAE